MSQNPLVIYHKDCADGFGAAFAAYLKFGDEAEYLPMAHGKDSLDGSLFASPRDVYILDFSFPSVVMSGIRAQANRVIWLDHHKTAFEMWCGGLDVPNVVNGRYARAGKSPLDNTHIVLDNNKSGALLAWEYFHPDTEAPMLFRHIDDHDRWQFKLEGTKEFSAYLWSRAPWTFEMWAHLRWMEPRPYTASNAHQAALYRLCVTEGAAILRAQQAQVQSLVKNARSCTLAGKFPGLVVNSANFHSEVGHELAVLSGTFGLVWSLGADNVAKCSLRSNANYDVSAIASLYGGGGHKTAAGFRTDIQTLLSWLA